MLVVVPMLGPVTESQLEPEPEPELGQNFEPGPVSEAVLARKWTTAAGPAAEFAVMAVVVPVAVTAMTAVTVLTERCPESEQGPMVVVDWVAVPSDSVAELN